MSKASNKNHKSKELTVDVKLLEYRNKVLSSGYKETDSKSDNVKAKEEDTTIVLKAKSVVESSKNVEYTKKIKSKEDKDIV